MASYTRYLTATAAAVDAFTIQILESSPIAIAQEAIIGSCEIRYSPIMPAFLTPGEGPPLLPSDLETVALFFANAPYKSLGTLKSYLRPDELSSVHFTEGLASLILLNSSISRAKEIRALIGDCPFEYWPLKKNKLDVRDIHIWRPPSKNNSSQILVQLPISEDPELTVYVEQIAASLVSLWASYGQYFPEERDSLRLIAALSSKLVKHYGTLQAADEQLESALVSQKKANSIISALVEISAALSYAVAQGTSGSLPILANRSPFPHHSLLGIGGAIRALTKYTRYLEAAFMERSASKVISYQYSIIKHIVPVSIAKYNSGPDFKFPDSLNCPVECFDCGGEFRQDDHVPLIAHFSLRHGFMESKFSVTAASEALTAETLPQWTLMTLSHEVMHSRVRSIFQALFGKDWNGGEHNRLISQEQFNDFAAWILGREHPRQTEVAISIRNAILNFCYAIEKAQNPIAAANDAPGYSLPMDKLCEYYARHKQLAIEIVVHFHDYYFVYACQPKMYIMSLWASWIKVAAPYARTREYLTRSLVTIACGTGLPPREAFNHAHEILSDGLDALEASGVRSSLFDELRRLTSGEEANTTRAFFYPCYYLMDIVRRFFASRRIASRIDRIENDPFAEGSTLADDYTANVYVYGEEESASPIRYSLATLFKTLSKQLPVNDSQWLTAWNYMVISSQETKTC